MPKRTDIKRVLVIGSGPIVIGQACEFDYSGTQACKALRGRGARGHARQQQPGDDHDRPRDRRSHLRRAADAEVARRDHRAASGPTRCCRRSAARPRSTSRCELGEHGMLEKYGVELIGASDRGDQGRRRSPAVPRRDARDRRRRAARARVRQVAGGGARRGRRDRASRSIIRPSFTLGGVGGGIAYNIEEFREIAERGLEHEPGARGPGRGVGDRLEGVRARGDARRRRQLRRHLLDREHRPDGRAHRRQHHRRAGADAHRQGIPADARRRRAASSAASASRPAARTSSSRSTRPTAGWSSSR